MNGMALVSVQSLLDDLEGFVRQARTELLLTNDSRVIAAAISSMHLDILLHHMLKLEDAGSVLGHIGILSMHQDESKLDGAIEVLTAPIPSGIIIGLQNADLGYLMLLPLTSEYIARLDQPEAPAR